ncbi:MarR family winged helix-turn-helix transcriptional regulator [Nocardioides pantholopis]|uniref:MarR family winged helix-turn-helix transcriptional regulator n=1 Tax=Nocardioides pantholopis TaxID=2483798 RepID=UPI000FD92D92|nr:MarR family transcriptional regulator [Nocardioides pantholopis]
MSGSDDRDRAESLRTVEREVGVLIRRIKRVIGERARAVDPALQPASYLMLDYLAQHGPMRSSDLAETFNVDKGAISRQVQHLVDLELVERTPDPDDRRAAQVAVSAEAKRRLADVSHERLAWLDQRLGEWDAAELAGFAESLGRYNALLSEPLGPEARRRSPQADPD